MAKTGEETQPMYEKQSRKRLSIKQWDLADRPREKMMMFGRTSLSNAELLAIIIGSGNANLSAVDLAKQILGSVGNNLHELSKLSYKDYCNRFKGIGPAKALNIIAALELGFRRKETAMLERQQIISSYDAYTHVAQFLLDLDYEAFYVIFLDIKSKVLKTECVSVGGWNTTVVDVRRIFKIALEYNAFSIILAHNHPSGDIQPSRCDFDTTKNICDAGKVMSINVRDHLIVGNGTFYSMLDNGSLP